MWDSFTLRDDRGLVRESFSAGELGPYAASISFHDYEAGTIDVPNTNFGPTPTDSLLLAGC
jgi:hypothetical protein